MTSVTAALIVRDEERFLPDCLRSLKDIVDDVVVVDTGSSDGTVVIAERFGARVSTFRWVDDFAAARNAALDCVTTTWVLYIDADERASVPGGRRIGDELDRAAHAGGWVKFRPRPGYTRYKEPRLFRSDPAIRFEGRIHETMVPDLFAYADAHALTLASTSACIDHYGFEGDQSHKVARNLPLLEAEVRRNPGRSYCWHHLAEMLVLAGRPDEAIARCREGLACPPTVDSAKEQVDRRQLTQTLARLLIESGAAADDLIAHLLQGDSDDYATLYLKARALLLSGRPEDALDVALRLKGIDPDTLDIGYAAYDLRLFGEFAWALVGAAHSAAGRDDAAADAFEQAWHRAPDNKAYLAKSVGLRAKSQSGASGRG